MELRRVVKGIEKHLENINGNFLIMLIQLIILMHIQIQNQLFNIVKMENL